MTAKASIIAGLLCLVINLSACGGGDGSSIDDGGISTIDDVNGGVIDTDSPYIIATNPVHNSVLEKTNRAITVTFNEAIEPASITSNSFILDDVNGGIVTGSVAYDEATRTATFRSDVNLATSTTYVATVTNEVEDLVGNLLSEDYTWQFSTAAPTEINTVDTTPPIVQSCFPVPNATAVAPNTFISVTFNEPIDPFTINAKTLTLKGTDLVLGSVSYVGKTALFEPTTDLEADAVYTVTVAGEIMDLAGNPLGSDMIWSFTCGSEADVAGPLVLSVSPPDGAINIPKDSAIVANFNEGITPFEFGIIDGRPVTVTFNDNYTKATIKPTSGLRPGANYTAHLRVQDQAGNPMNETFAWEFTVAN